MTNQDNSTEGLREVAEILGIKLGEIPYRNRNTAEHDCRTFFYQSALVNFGRIFAEDIRAWDMISKPEGGVPSRNQGAGHGIEPAAV